MKYVLTAVSIITVLTVIFYPRVGAETPIEPMPKLEHAPDDPCWYVEHLPSEPITPIIIKDQIKGPINCKNIADLS